LYNLSEFITFCFSTLNKKNHLHSVSGFGISFTKKIRPKPSGSIPEEFIKGCVFKILSVHIFNIRKKGGGVNRGVEKEWPISQLSVLFGKLCACFDQNHLNIPQFFFLNTIPIYPFLSPPFLKRRASGVRHHCHYRFLSVK
jgi:hypothetical protein